eukprot:gene2416-4689_t
MTSIKALILIFATFLSIPSISSLHHRYITRVPPYAAHRLNVGTQVYGKEVVTSPSVHTQVAIREAVYHELMHVVSLRMDVFYPELRPITSFHLRILEKLRQRVDQGGVCLIAVVNEKVLPCLQLHVPPIRILGSVEISPTDFRNTSMECIGHERKLYAMDLAVRGDVRRMGIASGLLAAVESYALTHSYQEIYLHVEVDNEGARNLYKKNGYIEVPETEWALSFTRHRLHKPPHCYVLLWKEIY